MSALQLRSSRFAGHSRTLGRKQIDTACVSPILSSDNSICPHHQQHQHPPISAISKVNTPLNAGLTHFHCGWLCFQFSHQLSHPTTLREEREIPLSRKQTKKRKTTTHAEGRHISSPSCSVLKGQKACREEMRGKKKETRAPFSHFFCGSEMVIAVFLPFFLSGRAWERPLSAAENPRGS